MGQYLTYMHMLCESRAPLYFLALAQIYTVSFRLHVSLICTVYPSADIPDLMTSVAQASGSGGGSDCDTIASPKKTPTKRKLEGNAKPSPKRSKPVCKYGPKCYQTNPKHMEEFEHPWASNDVCDTVRTAVDVCK